MKRYTLFALLSLFLGMPVAQARNIKLTLPIADALATSHAKQTLNKNIGFEFGHKTGHAVPITEERVYVKQNRSGFTDKAICEKLFVEVLAQLQDRAKSVGADTVTHIRSSYTQHAPLASHTEYECHTGRVRAGIALTGEFVNNRQSDIKHMTTESMFK